MSYDGRKKGDPSVYLTVDGIEIPQLYVRLFEWTAFINNGYVIRANIINAYQDTLNSDTTPNISIFKILEKARKDKVEVEFQIRWD